MTEDEIIAQLFPPFGASVRRVLEKCRIAELPFRVFCGVRSYSEQDRLYAQGRTVPGKIVTNARAGSSWHNFALGADLVLYFPDGNGTRWHWSWAPGPEWERMAEFAIAEGLEAGYFWTKYQDMPHIQNRYGLTIEQARNLYHDGGLDAVWHEARKNHV